MDIRPLVAVFVVCAAAAAHAAGADPEVSVSGGKIRGVVRRWRAFRPSKSASTANSRNGARTTTSRLRG